MIVKILNSIVNYVGTVMINIFLIYVLTLGLLYNNVFYVLINPYEFLTIITVLGFVWGHGVYIDYYFANKKECGSNDR